MTQPFVWSMVQTQESTVESSSSRCRLRLGAAESIAGLDDAVQPQERPRKLRLGLHESTGTATSEPLEPRRRVWIGANESRVEPPRKAA